MARGRPLPLDELDDRKLCPVGPRAEPSRPPAPPAEAPAPAPTDEGTGLLALLDALELPDTRDRPWVRVTTPTAAAPATSPVPTDISTSPELAPTRAALLAARSTDDARAALARLEVHGLAALATLDDALAALPANHPARPLAARTARRLASTIRAVHVDDASVTATLVALAGRPLEVDAVVAAIRRALERSPAGHLTVTAHRDGTGLGVTLRLRARRSPPESESTESPYTSAVTRAGGRPGRSHHSFGATSWDTLKTALDEVFETDGEREAEVVLDVFWRPPTP